jgi:hypothetical protein
MRPVELARNREESLSCGAAGVTRGYRIGGVLKVQAKRFKELREAGAGEMALICPGCHLTLAPQAFLRGVRLRHMPEELLRAFGDEISKPMTRLFPAVLFLPCQEGASRAPQGRAGDAAQAPRNGGRLAERTVKSGPAAAETGREGENRGDRALEGRVFRPSGGGGFGVKISTAQKAPKKVLTTTKLKGNGSFSFWEHIIPQ